MGPLLIFQGVIKVKIGDEGRMPQDFGIEEGIAPLKNRWWKSRQITIDGKPS